MHEQGQLPLGSTPQPQILGIGDFIQIRMTLEGIANPSADIRFACSILDKFIALFAREIGQNHATQHPETSPFVESKEV